MGMFILAFTDDMGMFILVFTDNVGMFILAYTVNFAPKPQPIEAFWFPLKCIWWCSKLYNINIPWWRLGFDSQYMYIESVEHNMTPRYMETPWTTT